MTSSDSEGRSNELNQVIAEYLRAVEVGESPDRDELLAKYPELADDLRSFFANDDQLKQAARSDSDAATLAPTNAYTAEKATIPPSASTSEDATIPPGVKASDHATIPPVESDGASTATVGTTVRYFGDYELLEEIARGGMGVVYKARQTSLNRTVALKMILAGQLAGEEDVLRFHAEAEAAANLDHPGIVPIYEVGEHDGQHYFSMGFVDGESLAERIKDGPLPPRVAAGYTKKVAEAIAFAHQRGVIHRDLKPANVLVDQHDEPKVTDFGLAKKVEGDRGLTATGQILGTPSYMPPEQASGKIEEIVQTADVYSLGAILYALLTGRAPFQADNHLDTLLQVLEQQPASPRILNPKVPVDLETICLKCLEKQRRHRYASAKSLCEELRRFLNQEPIRARPISAPARAWRWCKRKPAIASLSIAVALSLVLGTVVSSYLAYRAISEKERADNESRVAKENESRANRLAAEATRQAELARHSTYNVQLARVRDVDRDPSLARELLLDSTRCPSHLRDFTWRYYYRRSNTDPLTLDGPNLPRCVAFSPDGRILAVAHGKQVTVYGSVFGEEQTRLTHSQFVGAMAFSPDGKTMATGGLDKIIRLWDVEKGQERMTLSGHTGSILAITFSYDGKSVAAAGIDLQAKTGDLRLWDAVTGQLVLSSLGGDDGIVSALAFSRNDKILASAHGDSIKLWDLTEGRQITTLAGNSGLVTCV